MLITLFQLSWTDSLLFLFKKQDQHITVINMFYYKFLFRNHIKMQLHPEKKAVPPFSIKIFKESLFSFSNCASTTHFGGHLFTYKAKRLFSFQAFLDSNSISQCIKLDECSDTFFLKNELGKKFEYVCLHFDNLLESLTWFTHLQSLDKRKPTTLINSQGKKKRISRGQGKKKSQARIDITYTISMSDALYKSLHILQGY